MKYAHLIILLVFFSCGQQGKEKQTATTEIQITEPDSTVQQVSDTVIEKAVSQTFDEVIAQSKVKSLPQIEVTNFDSFIEEGDYTEVDVKTLKLEEIYPDFHTKSHNYKAISNYKIPLSTDFHTVVVTIKKGDNEMETVLINYDQEGAIIAHRVVAYDEIAEGMSRIVSRISPNRLTVHRIFWDVSKEVEETVYQIRTDGRFEKLSAGILNESIEEFTLIDAVLTDLRLNWVQIKTDLIAIQEHPFRIDEAILVIPGIVDEAEQYFELNSHIVLVDPRSGNISHQFYEGAANSSWVSDAVELKEIRIDSALYQVSEEKEAYGVRVSFVGMSRANPYEHETLSLFTKIEDDLRRVLENYPVMQYNGEWDTDCEGEFVREEKTLSMDSTKSKGLFDFTVNNEITATTNYVDDQGDCDYEEQISTETQVLKFNGIKYEHDQ
ncbi:hypothetical protein [Reichenbachiella ulvae]|uniref:Lipoprotein n=1 Tax=Reichenbachiella ulvae TaxID=2980104 RepID=A0ABT3CUZ8_9BACT|nr:hypothetical protein [Reichenbachiella ulvae]MCV9387394.1 hypothetical protein [Reichenbachiella ulvae]